MHGKSYAAVFKSMIFGVLILFGSVLTTLAQSEIIIGVRDTVHSVILGEDREIWVHVPKNALGAEKKYPVVYLLDGDAHFYSVTGMIHQLSPAADNDACPEMIVVGILNVDRDRDMTPTFVKETFGDTLSNVNSGGLGKFTDFIAGELIPFIEQNYPATTHRTYVGHSLGGLAVAHTLLERPEIFNNYIIIDGSFWWDDNLIIRLAKQRFAEKSYAGERVYLAVANTLMGDIPLEEALADTAKESFFVHVQSLHAFAQLAESERADGMFFNWKYYPNEGHNRLPLIAEYDGLTALFKWYAFDDNVFFEFMDPSSGRKNPEDLIKQLTGHYESMSNYFGYTVLPDEAFVNRTGYIFMMNGLADIAYACFALNVRNYPSSGNVYDSMGDYHVHVNDPEKAIEYYTKALEIKTTEHTKAKLDALLQDTDN